MRFPPLSMSPSPFDELRMRAVWVIALPALRHPGLDPGFIPRPLWRVSTDRHGSSGRARGWRRSGGTHDQSRLHFIL